MRLFLVLALAIYAVADDGPRCGDADAPDCSLECNNRGTCCIGILDDSHQPTNPNDAFEIDPDGNVAGQYCDCALGWTGKNCDTTFDECDNDANACFNNGTCVSGFLDSGDKVYMCDCREARDDAGISYVGMYCEQAVPEVGDMDDSDDDSEIEGDSVICDDDGSVYCLNGGECKFS